MEKQGVAGFQVEVLLRRISGEQLLVVDFVAFLDSTGLAQEGDVLLCKLSQSAGGGDCLKDTRGTVELQRSLVRDLTEEIDPEAVDLAHDDGDAGPFT